jgi:hypothetical protein
MVAFSGQDPIGVLIGAKRPSGTLIHKVAIHPDHLRQGHGRHLLTSLGSKLAILGPPRIVAEVPETLLPACALFSGCGYVNEAALTDYLLENEAIGEVVPGEGRFVIPVSVEDLAANGLIGGPYPPVCWERSVETLTARQDEVSGIAVASDERIEACVLYVRREARGEILLLRSFVENGGARLKQLFSQLCAQGMGGFTFPKVHPAEISNESLESIGFRAAARYVLYTARAKSE